MKKIYNAEITKPAIRRYKKFPQELKERIKEEAKIIAQNPYSYKLLHPPFRKFGIRSYSFNYKDTGYRIAYQIDESRQAISILLVKTREGFYDVLEKLLQLR